MKRTTIAISDDVKKQIFKLGKMGDTPNDIILRLLQHYKQTKNSKKHKPITLTSPIDDDISRAP